MEVDQDKDKDEQDRQTADAAATAAPSGATLTNTKVREDEVTLDIESTQNAFKALFDIPDHPFLASLINALVTLSYNVEMELKYHQPYERDPNYLNLFLIVIEIPGLHSPEFVDKAFPQFCKVLGQLPVSAQAKLARLWSRYSRERLQGYLEMLQQLVTVSVISGEWGAGHIVNDSDGITGATRVMKIIYYACLLGGATDPAHILQREKELKQSSDENMQEFFQGAVSMEPKEKTPPKADELGNALSVNPIDCRQPLIPFDDFINEPLNEQIEMDKDYPNYYKSDAGKFSFMNHQFILTPATKSLGLFFDSRIRMLNERRTSILQSLVRGAPSTPYLRLRIRRDHVIDDALVGVSSLLRSLSIRLFVFYCNDFPSVTSDLCDFWTLTSYLLWAQYILSSRDEMSYLGDTVAVSSRVYSLLTQCLRHLVPSKTLSGTILLLPSLPSVMSSMTRTIRISLDQS